jgi:hypothetical protein
VFSGIERTVEHALHEQREVGALHELVVVEDTPKALGTLAVPDETTTTTTTHTTKALDTLAVPDETTTTTTTHTTKALGTLAVAERDISGARFARALR